MNDDEPKLKRVKATVADGSSSRYCFRSNNRNAGRFSAGRLASSETLHCKNLTGHHSAVIRAMDFSEDGSLLVSGGGDDRVLVWRMDQVLDRSRSIP